MRRLGLLALVVALIGGATAAFAVAEALKLERSPVTGPRFDKHFSPVCGCPQRTATLALRLRKADRIDVSVVDAEGERVRTLARNERRAKGVVTFRWNGRDDEGRPAPDGRYRVRIELRRAGRTIVIPNPVRLDTSPPRVRLVRVGPRTISPDGDRRKDRIEIVYRVSEPAWATQLVDGAETVRGRLRPAGRGRLAWAARDRPAGVYELAVVARDRAGNVSEPASAGAVRVRYVELARNVVRAARGGTLRFRVVADAPRFRWSVVKPRAGRIGPPLLSGRSRRSVVVAQLPLDLRRGLYILRVEARGHRDRALLRILGRNVPLRR